MALRIVDKEQAKGLSPAMRKQVERHLDRVDETLGALLGPATHRTKVNRPEEDAGRMLVEWIDLLVLPNGLRPGLFFMHTPNGLARNATEGGIFKAQGLRKGWPDYSLDLPLGRYHGLRGELKATDGAKPTREQLDILERLESVGYKCCVWWGFDDARKQISEYLDLAR